MWRESLIIWKLSIIANPLSVGLLVVLFALLTIFSLVPPLTFLLPLIQYYVIFAFVVYVSKKYLESGGDEERLRKLLGVGLHTILTSYPKETLAVLIAQLFLTALAVLVALIIIFVGGVWLLIKPLLEGGEVSWWGLLVSVGVALFIYFSVVTSFPIFFGRAMLRGRGFGETLEYFITSLYAEISWKTILNWDYIKSSAVISVISLGLLIAGFFVGITPLAPALTPFMTFLTVHLLYTFGTVACFKLLRS